MTKVMGILCTITCVCSIHYELQCVNTVLTCVECVNMEKSLITGQHGAIMNHNSGFIIGIAHVFFLQNL